MAIRVLARVEVGVVSYDTAVLPTRIGLGFYVCIKFGDMRHWLSIGLFGDVVDVTQLFTASETPPKPSIRKSMTSRRRRLMNVAQLCLRCILTVLRQVLLAKLHKWRQRRAMLHPVSDL